MRIRPIDSILHATAGIVLAASLGACSSAPTQAAPGAARATSGKMTFAILMYERNDAWHRLPPAQRDILLKKYGLWVRGLKEAGVLREGNPLGRGGVVIDVGTDGVPDAEPLDVNDTSLTGYFVIEVASAAEAERIAATCPALTHGEIIHLRPVGHVD